VGMIACVCHSRENGNLDTDFNKMKNYHVYIMTNKPNGTLYVGVTNDLTRRSYEHRNSLIDGFTKKYNLKMLVYFEVFDRVEYAILREKRLKKWSREWKIDMIEKSNPGWMDLYNQITGG
jgi:putative endonuclease